jgi:hypothetical protein
MKSRTSYLIKSLVILEDGLSYSFAVGKKGSGDCGCMVNHGNCVDIEARTKGRKKPKMLK